MAMTSACDVDIVDELVLSQEDQKEIHHSTCQSAVVGSRFEEIPAEALTEAVCNAKLKILKQGAELYVVFIQFTDKKSIHISQPR